MAVVEAKIETVEEIYRLVWTAVANKRPIAASYHGRPRLFCPHRLGRNKEGELRVLCYQYGGGSGSGLESAGSPANWRCIMLEKLRAVKLLDDHWRTGAKPFKPDIVCCRSGHRLRRSSRTRSAKRTLSKSREQAPGNRYPQRGNRYRVMPLGTNGASRADGIPPPFCS